MQVQMLAYADGLDVCSQYALQQWLVIADIHPAVLSIQRTAVFSFNYAAGTKRNEDSHIVHSEGLIAWRHFALYL